MGNLAASQVASLSLRFANNAEISSVLEGLGELSQETQKVVAAVDRQLANAAGQIKSLRGNVEALGKALTALEREVAKNTPAVGSLRQVARDAQVGADWKKCDGSALLVENYSTLYSIIGNSYGGDSTNFNLPSYNADLVDPLYIIKVR